MATPFKPSLQPSEESVSGVGPEHLLVVCAWCGAELYRPTKQVLRTSHSICEACAERVIADNTRTAIPAGPSGA